MFRTELLEEKLKYKFQNPVYLTEALTHSSYVGSTNNERLEFLGDAVLDIIVSEYIFRKKNLDEGKLTKIRALVVCEESLANVGNSIQLGKFLKMGAGEEKSGGRHKKSIIADAMEAVIGAVFIDADLETARSVVLDLFEKRIQQVIDGKVYSDYKSRLQELVQEKNPAGGLPMYSVEKEDGPDHDKVFHVIVRYAGKTIGRGKGANKKSAEQDAAKNALILGGTDVF